MPNDETALMPAITPGPDNMATLAEESAAGAARRYAGELERLRAGVTRLCPDHAALAPGASVDEWPATAALSAITERTARIVELEADVERFRDAHGEACKTLAEMHAAAVGEVRGPIRGVVEDVADVAAAAARARELERILTAWLIEHSSGDADSLAKCIGPELATTVVAVLDRFSRRVEVLEQENAAAADAMLAARFPTMPPAPPVPALLYDRLALALGESPRHAAPAPDPVEAVDAIAVTPDLEPVRDTLDAVPSAALRADMQKIAVGYRGVAYDPHDRPAEILAVRRAAVAAGLVPVPDESLLRGYRGCTPPVPPADMGAALRRAAAAVPPPTIRAAVPAPADAPDAASVDATLANIRPLLVELATRARAAVTGKQGGTRPAQGNVVPTEGEARHG